MKILTGKQFRARGGRSEILTGFSDCFGGIGRVGGMITSSKVYISDKDRLFAHVEYLPRCALRHRELASMGHGFVKTSPSCVYVR